MLSERAVPPHHPTGYSITDTVGPSIIAGSGITVAAERDFTAVAALVSAEGALAVFAGGNIDIGAAHDRVISEVQTTTTKKGWFSKKTTTAYDYSDEVTSVGSSFSGSTVTMQAGGNLTLTGSSITSFGDLALAAAGDLALAYGLGKSGTVGVCICLRGRRRCGQSRSPRVPQF